MRTIRLIERRTVERRLPRIDATALAADWPHVVEVLPTHERGRYRLTARGWVGTFATPNRNWQLTPKLGWAVAGRLFGDGQLGEAADPGGGLLSALAERLAALMRERQTAGLVHGYVDRSEHSAIVRGRIDFAAPQPLVGFTQVMDEFTADQPWNGWPLAIARRLLAGSLNPFARDQLRTATDGMGGVRPQPSPPTVHQFADPRLAGYRPLLAWCELIDRTITGGSLLVNLERLFELYLSRLTAEPHRGRFAVPQQEVLVRGRAGTPGVELRPDLVVNDTTGRPVAVWDVKWKSLSIAGPRPDDLHQALGYAAALGVRSAGLLYPGRRFTRRRYDTPGGVTATVATCRLAGDPARLARSDEAVRRLVLRP